MGNNPGVCSHVVSKAKINKRAQNIPNEISALGVDAEYHPQTCIMLSSVYDKLFNNGTIAIDVCKSEIRH